MATPASMLAPAGGSFYTSDQAYSINEFINNLGAYTLSQGLDEMLDLARQIEETQNYYWLGFPFPSTSDQPLDPLETFSGTITLPSLAYLVNITAGGVAYTTEGERQIAIPLTQGFKVRIYDKGGKIDSFINTTFARREGLFDGMGVDPVFGTPVAGPSLRAIGPYWLQSPMVVLAPGALQLEVTNLDMVNSCVCQLFLSLAVPVSRSSANEMLIGQHNKGN